MSKSYISVKIRKLVEDRAKGYCEYCLSPSNFSSSSFAIDHIEPESLGGATKLNNLAWSCDGCNGHKHTKTQYFDPISQKKVKLYHPRKDNWYEHFSWNNEETIIIGRTPTGRATVHLLDMNREGTVNLRLLLIMAGLHPPKDFPINFRTFNLRIG